MSGLIGSVASLCRRFGIFHADGQSAHDPQASFEQQRQLGAKVVDPNDSN